MARYNLLALALALTINLALTSGSRAADVPEGKYQTKDRVLGGHLAVIAYAEYQTKEGLEVLVRNHDEADYAQGRTWKTYAIRGGKVYTLSGTTPLTPDQVHVSVRRWVEINADTLKAGK